MKFAQPLNVIDLWANTKISHHTDPIESDFLQELERGSEVVVITNSEAISPYNGYYRAGRVGTAPKMLTRAAVYAQLKELAHLLAPRYGLMIFDAFRTLDTQRELYLEFHQAISKDFPKWTEQQIVDRTRLFVADPDAPPGPSFPGHNTGGAIDLQLFLRSDQSLVNFGTEIDALTDPAQTDYFEAEPKAGMSKETWLDIRRNRRILFNGMKSLGFVNLPSEWWHYDLGNYRFADAHGVDVIYTSMEGEALACFSNRECTSASTD